MLLILSLGQVLQDLLVRFVARRRPRKRLRTLTATRENSEVFCVVRRAPSDDTMQAHTLDFSRSLMLFLSRHYVRGSYGLLYHLTPFH